MSKVNSEANDGNPNSLQIPFTNYEALGNQTLTSPDGCLVETLKGKNLKRLNLPYDTIKFKTGMQVCKLELTFDKFEWQEFMDHSTNLTQNPSGGNPPYIFNPVIPTVLTADVWVKNALPQVPIKTKQLKVCEKGKLIKKITSSGCRLGFKSK